MSITYIALFRVGRRQVQFSDSTPLPISNGDAVVVAGRLWRGTLHADAVCNATTRLTKHSGIVSRVLVALALLVVGWFSTLAATGVPATNGRWLFLGLAAGALYLLWRAAQTGSALHAVHSSAR